MVLFTLRVECVVSVCVCDEDLHKRGVWRVKYMCVCVLGEGLTIVCACFTEPQWQRERKGASPLTPEREREREGGRGGECELM